MRTKTLLVAAALSAVGLGTSMAQVYSVNAVGFVNVTIPKGAFLIIANPLDAGSGNNTVAKLFPNVPDGFTVYKYTPGTGYSINSFALGDWADPNQTLLPGEGAFVLNSDPANDVKITFVGEVMQGALSTALPAGLSIASSKVPQAGVLDTDLGFPSAEGDTVYRFARLDNPAGYAIYSYTFGAWAPKTPSIDVAEGFFVSKAAQVNWTRTFSVNP